MRQCSRMSCCESWMWRAKIGCTSTCPTGFLSKNYYCNLSDATWQNLYREPWKVKKKALMHNFCIVALSVLPVCYQYLYINFNCIFHPQGAFLSIIWLESTAHIRILKMLWEKKNRVIACFEFDNSSIFCCVCHIWAQ